MPPKYRYFPSKKSPGVVSHPLLACSLLAALSVPAAAAPSFRFVALPPESGTPLETLSPADIDKDGDLDFFSGRFRTADWYENLGPGGWKRHQVADTGDTDVGAAAMDVDGDGWVDRVSGSFWHRNPGSAGGRFTTYRYGDLAYVHDLQVGDMDGDGHKDVVSMLAREIFWLRRPPNPLAGAPWERHAIIHTEEFSNHHGGLSVGDLDGDGDLDAARLDCWFENPGSGTGTWTRHAGPAFGQEGTWGLTGRALVIDVDGDGARDLVQAECDVKNGRVAWFRNRDGKGGGWDTHLLKDSTDGQDFHSLLAEDFDGDGDRDILSMGGINGAGTPKAYVWERLDSAGTRWKEHVLLEGTAGHDLAAGDFDDDGDLDVVGKTRADSVLFLFENQLIPSTGIAPFHLRRDAPAGGLRPPFFLTPSGPSDILGRRRGNPGRPSDGPRRAPATSPSKR